jgi:UDP-2,3-diacylglucosamine pyrophosphatase LpxH
MKLLETVLPKTHNVYLFGDSHKGTILQHKKGFRKMLKTLQDDPVGYGVHMGDSIEALMIDDKRWCNATYDKDYPLPLQQYEEVAAEMECVADKMVVYIEGNHDWTITNKVGPLLKSIVCKTIAAKANKDGEYLYGTHTCKMAIRSRTGDLLYKMFLTHGYRSISSIADDPVRRKSNMELALKRLLFRKAGDCIIQAMGHTHKLMVKEPIPELFLTDDGKQCVQDYTKTNQTDPYIAPDLRWYINTGCFYRLYHEGVSGYAERKGYDPNELGYAVVEVKDGNIQGVRKVII